MKIVFVPTIVKRLNDHQVGDIVRVAIENIDTVSGISFQPVAFTGRIAKHELLAKRFTLADLARCVSDQTGITEMHTDWFPLACASSYAVFQAHCSAARHRRAPSPRIPIARWALTSSTSSSRWRPSLASSTCPTCCRTKTWRTPSISRAETTASPPVISMVILQLERSALSRSARRPGRANPPSRPRSRARVGAAAAPGCGGTSKDAPCRSEPQMDAQAVRTRISPSAVGSTGVHLPGVPRGAMLGKEGGHAASRRGPCEQSRSASSSSPASRRSARLHPLDRIAGRHPCAVHPGHR